MKRDRRDKMLAEWFWTDRWMGSRGFLLPLEPRGLYREMLTQAWNRGGKLPKDHEAIRRATGCTLAEWKRCWPAISTFWKEDGEYIINETQVEVYEAAKAALERASKRGRSGGLARGKRNSSSTQVQLKHNSSTTQVELDGKPPSLSLTNTLDRVKAPDQHQANDPLNANIHAAWSELSLLTGEDPTEIIKRVSMWQGRWLAVPYGASENRRIHILSDLRDELIRAKTPKVVDEPYDPAKFWENRNPNGSLMS